MRILDRIKLIAKSMKRKINILFIASKREDISIITRIVMIIVLGYALSPIDLIPDFIPVLGYLDDLVLLPLGIFIVIKLLPKHIYDECELIVLENESKPIPRNKVAGVIVVSIWIVFILVLIRVAARYFA